MPKSVASFYSRESHNESQDGGLDDDAEDDNTTPTSPILTRSLRIRSTRASDLNLRSRISGNRDVDETSSLLANSDPHLRSYTYKSVPTSVPGTPRPFGTRNSSFRVLRNHSRHGSNRDRTFSTRLVNALGSHQGLLSGTFFEFVITLALPLITCSRCGV